MILRAMPAPLLRSMAAWGVRRYRKRT